MRLTNGMGSIMCAIVKSTMGMRSAMGIKSSLIGSKTQESYDHSSKKKKSKSSSEI